MKTVFIDFDGTICPNKNGDSLAPPSQECLDVLNSLKLAGQQIIIYSVRSNKRATSKPNGQSEMLKYLNEHKVPYDGIDSGKGHFSTVIDDKGLGVPLDENGNVDWTKARSLLEKKNYIFTKEAEKDLQCITMKS